MWALHKYQHGLMNRFPTKVQFSAVRDHITACSA
jgi:hypothetical protein